MSGLSDADSLGVLVNACLNLIEAATFVLDLRRAATNQAFLAALDLIAKDPPDPNYTVVVAIPEFQRFTPVGDSEVEKAMADWNTGLAEAAAISEALLASQERLQGAALADDTPYILLQAEAVDQFIDLLVENQTQFARSLQIYIDELEIIINSSLDDLAN